MESIVSRCACAVATAPAGSTLTPAKRARTGPSASTSSARAASSRICRSSASVGAIVRASPSKALSVVPTRRRPAQGTAKATRVRSIGIVTAAPQPPSRSSTRCAPLLRVTEVPACGSSSRRTSSIHGPAALTTARTPTSNVSPVSVSRSWATGPRSSPASSTRLSTAAPASAAPRRLARQSRASSVWASGVEACGAKAVEPERRDESHRSRRRDHPPPLRDGARQTRVRPERATDRNAPVRAAAVDREHELQRRDEMGGDVAAEGVHLGERLADEAEMPEAQVAKPAVDQLRRRARRARGEVVALDDRDVQPVPGSDLGDAGADDPAADDEEVEPPCVADARAPLLARSSPRRYSGASPRVGEASSPGLERR